MPTQESTAPTPKVVVAEVGFEIFEADFDTDFLILAAAGQAVAAASPFLEGWRVTINAVGDHRPVGADVADRERAVAFLTTLGRQVTA